MPTAPTQKIYRFGTSGYRNDREDGFNETVIRQITHAIADYLIDEIREKGRLLPVLIGGDTREKTRRFLPLVAELLRERGLDVYRAKTDLPSPVLAYAARYFAGLGLGPQETLGAVLMTASHNPWPYGGYNFLTPDGAVMPTRVSSRIEAYQANPANHPLDRAAYGVNTAAAITEFDPYPLYQRHLKEGLAIRYDAIRESGLKIFYDPLYATGRLYLPRLLQDEGIEVRSIHDTDRLPDGYTGMPEPTGSNLPELSALVRSETTSTLKVGLSNDGDADRFGVLDENGRYLNSNEVLTLILHHLIKNKKQTGAIVRSQATTHLLDALAEQAGLPVIQTPVGYKYIAEEFIEHEAHGDLPVLIGGESSGGVSVLGHLPEKDGVLANLLVAELVATEGRPLGEILKTVQASVSRQFRFRELGVRTERGQDIMAHFQSLLIREGLFGGFAVDVAGSVAGAEALKTRYGVQDGAKVLLAGGSWLLIRASGTEPIVRVYVEGLGNTPEEAQETSQRLLEVVTDLLHGTFGVPQADVREKI